MEANDKKQTSNIPDKLWDGLSDEVRQLLDKSIEQSIKGEVRPYEEVMDKISKKYNIA